MASQQKIIVITAGGAYAWVIVNALASRFENLEVVLEQPESKSLFLKRRARKIGWVQTAGQFGTMVISRFGKRFASKRTTEIIASSGARPDLPPELPVTRVSSANGSDCLDLITARKPDVIFLAGCRMLSKATLAAIPCPVINYHSGINPKYRGLAGGWWARATGDHENYGTTVHLVDAGVDTGGDAASGLFHTASGRNTADRFAGDGGWLPRDRGSRGAGRARRESADHDQ
jgi:hypothetical protein